MAKAKALDNKKMELNIDGFVIKADLPKAMGGDEAYPNPLQLLQSALLSCATAHAFAYLDKIGQDRHNFKVELEPVFSDPGTIKEATIIIYAPADFPQDREAGLIAASQNCIVGRHIVFPRKTVIIKQ